MVDSETSGRAEGDRTDHIFETYFALADRIAALLWRLCMGLAVLLVVIVAGQVFTRYLLGWVPLWGGELSRYLGIGIALLLTPVFVWQDRHLQVETLFRKLSKRARRRVRTAQLALIAVLGLVIANWGLVYAIESGFGQTSPSMDFQMYYVYVWIPISGVLILFFAVGKAIEINYEPDTLEEDYLSRFRFDEAAEDPAVEETE